MSAATSIDLRRKSSMVKTYYVATLAQDKYSVHKNIIKDSGCLKT